MRLNPEERREEGDRAPWPPDLFPYRNHPLAVLEQHLPRLPAEALSWVPPGGRNSIGWLLRHIWETEDDWVHRLA